MGPSMIASIPEVAREESGDRPFCQQFRGCLHDDSGKTTEIRCIQRKDRRDLPDGHLSNDALIVAVMQAHSLTNLASNDS